MPTPPTSRAAGFTLLELLIASGLSIGLTLIAAQFCGYFLANVTDLNARARAAQELRFAVSSITRDMGPAVGATVMAGNQVLLCKDGGDVPDGVADWAPPDTLILYSWVDGQLLRQDQSTGVEIVVADDVSAFAVEDVAPSVLQISITVQRRDLSRQASLLWSRP